MELGIVEIPPTLIKLLVEFHAAGFRLMSKKRQKFAFKRPQQTLGIIMAKMPIKPAGKALLHFLTDRGKESVCLPDLL